MQVKKQQLEPDIQQQTGSKWEKKYVKAEHHHPVYLTSMQSTSCEILGWMKHKRIKTAKRNIKNLRYSDDTTLMAERKEELKSLLMKERDEWKSWLKTQHSENKDHGIWSNHFMANRWGNNGNIDRFYFLGLQNDWGC